MTQNQTGPALVALRADDENLRTALDWLADQSSVDQNSELRMVVALMHYWRRIGRISEAATRLDGALRRRPKGDLRLRARALAGAGYMGERSQGDQGAAVQC